MTDIDKYCQQNTSPHSDLLAELERETYLKTLSPQMLTGQYQGRLLSIISKMSSPKNILEVGTFTGYSALCLASGLQDKGSLITIEVNPEISHISSKYFNKSIYKKKINAIIGDALNVIPTLNLTFDLVFIDAAKFDYSHYYDLILPKVNSGGIILTDNVLWSGKVINKKKDKDTTNIDLFNKKILADNRVENIILPIRDGINIIRKY